MKIAGFTLHLLLHTNFTCQCTFLGKTLCAFMVSQRKHYMYRQKCTKNNIILVSTHAHIIRCKTTSLQSLLNKSCMHKVMCKTQVCILINSTRMRTSLNFCTRMRTPIIFCMRTPIIFCTRMRTPLIFCTRMRTL